MFKRDQDNYDNDDGLDRTYFFNSSSRGPVFTLDDMDEEEEDKENHSFIEVEGYRRDNEAVAKRRFRLLLLAVLGSLVAITLIVIFVYAISQHNNNNLDDDGVLKPLVPYLIVISLDGGRWDYLNRGLTPNINSLFDNGQGIRAEYMSPQFPAKTFPNHFTLATGLYPEYHGIISNHMYDPSIGQNYNVENQTQVEQPFWYWGEPIWVTAVKKGLTTACYYWPGCNAPIENILPTYNQPGFAYTTASQAFSTVLKWQTDSHPNLTMVYIHDIDSVAHIYGPMSQQVNDTIVSVDKAIGQFIEDLKDEGLYPYTNILIVSDHGMTTITNYIDINQWIDITKVYIPDSTPILSIFPIEGGLSIEEIYDALYNKSEHLQIYLKDEIPNSYLFSNPDNDRIAPVIGIADLGYSIIATKKKSGLGDHGYSPSYMDMKAMFVAHGPNIDTSQSSQLNNNFTFSNTDLFPFYTSLLKISGLTGIPSTNGTSFLSNLIYKSK